MLLDNSVLSRSIPVSKISHLTLVGNLAGTCFQPQIQQVHPPRRFFRKRLDTGGNDLAILKSKFPSIANDCDPTNGIIFGSTENTFDLCRCLWAWGLWGHRLSSWRGISCHLSIHPRSSTSTSTMTCKDFQNLIDLELPDHLPSEVKCDLGVKRNTTHGLET